jgi:hypothetical protein
LNIATISGLLLDRWASEGLLGGGAAGRQGEVPERYGRWNIMARCLCRWDQRGIWQAMGKHPARAVAVEGYAATA